MWILFFLNLCLFIVLVALGLRCCVQAFSSCSKQELLIIGVPGLLILVTSLVVQHGFYGAWAQLPRSRWNLPEPGMEPVSSALGRQIHNPWTLREVLECGFLTTEPPGSPRKFRALLLFFLYWHWFGSTAPSYFGVPGAPLSAGFVKSVACELLFSY